MATDGARLAIRLLQDAAERGDLDPWDVDVIAVVDGFLDQLRQRIEVPRLVAVMGRGGSYEQDLAETSEAFLAAPGDQMYRDYGFFSSFEGPTGNRIAILSGLHMNPGYNRFHAPN